jgi:hypothetical protein
VTTSNRREFCADVGRGVLIAAVGAPLCAELGLGTVHADEKSNELSFGKIEPLVDLMQETPPAKLMPILVKKLREGTKISDLVGAAALANARTFGGEDYVGFHTVMAMSPAYHMAEAMPEGEQPLPVLKVLYRNSKRIQEQGGRKNEVLHPVHSDPGTKATGEALREKVHNKDMKGAEKTFAALAAGRPDEALDELLLTVQDCLEVHRVVLPYRAYDLLPVVGKEHAHTMLRQSVRYCVKNDSPAQREHYGSAHKLLPELLESLEKTSKSRKPREANDAWVDQLGRTIFKSTPDDAARAVAEALAAGYATADVGQALTLATNQLVLRDEGRKGRQIQPGKPEGSVHGDSIGLHATDSANAWRNLSRLGGPRNQAACLILGAWQASHDRTNRSGDFLKWEPYPRADARKQVKGKDEKSLLAELNDAIKNKDQALATAVTACYGEKGFGATPLFAVLLHHAVCNDGALHAEKFYRTVSEEFATTRPSLRWRHLVALARVSASESGYPAPGYAQACELLKK